MLLAIVMFTWIGLTAVAVSRGLYATARYPSLFHHRLPAVPVVEYVEDIAEPLGYDYIGLI